MSIKASGSGNKFNRRLAYVLAKVVLASDKPPLSLIGRFSSTSQTLFQVEAKNCLTPSGFKLV